MNKLHGKTSLHELIRIYFNFKIDYIEQFFTIDIVYYSTYKLQDPIYLQDNNRMGGTQRRLMLLHYGRVFAWTNVGTYP